MTRVLVEVEWGPLRGRRAAVLPGATLRVGRFERADLVVPHDEHLSGLHFHLSWDGAECRVRDLGSMEGTLHNGERVTEALVASGDWIRAGSTFFSVYFEAPPPDERDEGTAAPLLAALAAEAAPLFAVLDAASDRRVLDLLKTSAEEHRCLYEGRAAEELARVAPYLVSLPRGSSLLRRLVREGRGKSWGIYLACRRPFAEVRRHLRRFLMTQPGERGERYQLRYYDPRVLPVLVPLLPPRQALALFGEIEGFWIEGSDGAPVHLTPPSYPGPGQGSAALSRG
jgi:hypothetical protein